MYLTGWHVVGAPVTFMVIKPAHTLPSTKFRIHLINNFFAQSDEKGYKRYLVTTWVLFWGQVPQCGRPGTSGSAAVLTVILQTALMKKDQYSTYSQTKPTEFSLQGPTLLRK